MVELDRKASSALKLRMTALGVLLAASAAVSGCSLLPEEQAPLKPPLVKPAQAEVKTIDAKLGSIVRQIAGSGTFVPTNIAYYQFKNGGVIEAVHVRAGSEVKRGDILVTLESEGIDVELLQRELEYERKRLAFEDAVKNGNERQSRIARIDYELAKLLYDKSKVKAGNSVLRAEADGIVSYATDLMPGDRAEAGRVLAAVADPSGMRLALLASSNPVLADIKVGMEAEITFKGLTLTGKVTQTPATAPQTDDDRLREEYTRTLYIELDELPAEAVLGAMADVRIIAARRDNVIVVPKSGVRTYFGRTYVQVLDGERRREIDIETGLETATEYEIMQGIEEGMKIILQ
jgi:multidrug efflux pump subunit AcrA (membrane-fusion protein)